MPVQNGCTRMLPYFCPPPVPLMCVCANPSTRVGMGSQPLLGAGVQSGEGFTMPKGHVGPMNTRPSPSLPMRRSTYLVRGNSSAEAAFVSVKANAMLSNVLSVCIMGEI